MTVKETKKKDVSENDGGDSTNNEDTNDKIYMNRENRQLMKDFEIKAMGKPLGRPHGNQDIEYQVRMAKSVSQRTLDLITQTS